MKIEDRAAEGADRAGKIRGNGVQNVKCNQRCEAAYSADVDDCRFQFNTPADADALTDCIQRARDDYRNEKFAGLLRRGNSGAA